MRVSEMEKQETAVKAAAKVIAVVIAPLVYIALNFAFFPLTVYCAWCDMHLWNWFAAPYLHIAPMSLWVSVGFGLYFRAQTTACKSIKGEEVEFWRSIWTSIVLHSCLLATGYVIVTRAAVHF